MINLPKEVNQILNIVKAKYNLNTKSEAITKVVEDYGTKLLEPELKPEFVEKINNIERKGDFSKFGSMEELKKSLENA